MSASSALREIVAPGCGAAVDDHAPAFASAVTSLLADPEPDRHPRPGRGVPWPATVDGMLAALRAW